VTPDTLYVKSAGRPRVATRPNGLYAPLGWAMVRAPLLAAGGAAAAGAGAPDGSLLPEDPRVRVAVEVASADLTAALARTRPQDAKAARVAGKLRRYLIRMSTRPTPYGMFAGVGLVDWGPATSLALGPEPPRTRTRPDMGWLLDLVATLEDDPEIRSGLRLTANPAVMLRGGRAFLRDLEGQTVSVRATGTVRRALELARDPVPRLALAERLGAAPGATPEKVDRLLDELVRQGLLLADLRPPLTGADPAGYVRDRLAGIAAGRAVADRLTELLEQLAAWDRLPLQERAGRWPGLLDQAHALHPTAPSASLLQVDMALPLAGATVQAEVGVEVARAAELLLRLSPYADGPPHLEAYRQAFTERYGHDREVPLVELLDPDLGLGAPTGHGPDQLADQRARGRRDRLLCELALDAHRCHRLVVDLDDRLLGRLQTWAPQAATAPRSLDISVQVAASSPAAVDAGDFLVVVGPNLGATSAGRNLGRFADLLGPQAQAALAEIAAVEAALAPGRVIAEVVYPPQRPRSANVAVRPAVRSHEILFAARPGTAGRQAIPANELVVGVRDGRFAVRWPVGDLEVVGVQGHMLNLLQAPPAARFLLEVAGEGRCQLSSFDWGAAAAFPFLPRVQHGRIVLALAQWQVDSATGELPTEPADRFPSALEAWRGRWSVPQRVYLTVGDNRLLLDLEDADHAELLREELKAVPDGYPARLQEALPGPWEAWLPAPDGGHITELVVPVALRAPAALVPSGRSAGPRASPAPTGVRLRPPGSDWLYVKLYGPQLFEDELIAGSLRSFAEFAVNAGLSGRWHFLRYRDPDPHLRVRFHGEPATLLGRLLRQLCDWAGELVASGVRTRLAFDTYEREVERYGGADGMLAAEAIFAADSPAVAEVLHLRQEVELPFDLTTLAVLSMDDLLAGVGLDERERAAVYLDAPPGTPEHGQEYRRRKDELRRLLGGPDALRGTPEGAALASLLDARRAALAPTATLLRSLEREARLQHPLAKLCRSYLHLHVNRLLGTSPPYEQLALQLLRRTREGLIHAPVT
jgi:thiopeptide-type bacteriocin biosynthesis protein